MERSQIRLTAVVLLLSGLGHGRADYVFPYRVGGLGSASQFSNPQSIPVHLSGSVLVSDALNHRIQVFISSGVFVTRFGTQSSGYMQIFESRDVDVGPSGLPVMVVLLNPSTRRLSSDGTFFLGAGSFDSKGANFHSVLGSDSAPSEDFLVADTFDRRIETPTSHDPFLGSFGFTLGELPPAEPSRVVVGPPADALFKHKVGWSLIVLGLGGLATLAFAWRLRKPPLHRAPAGRRPISHYRSPSIPKPGGTISSPPP